MPEPATSGAVTTLETILKLWDRSVALLLALFGICAVLLVLAVTARWLGRADYLSNYGIYLVIGSVVFGGLAIARTIERAIEQKKPSFHFTTDDDHSCWSITKQPNGDVFTQISLHFQATNMTRRALRPSKAILKRPLLLGSRPMVNMSTQDPRSRLYSRDTMIHAGFTRNVHLHFMVPKNSVTQDHHFTLR